MVTELRVLLSFASLYRKTAIILVLALLTGSSLLWAQEELPAQIDYLGQRVSALEEYVTELPDGLETQMKFYTREIIKLSFSSKNYQAISTNSGTFLVAVDELKRGQDGYSLMVKVGNMSDANFQGFAIRLRWGAAWDAKGKDSYAQWRKTLTQSEFKFNGKLERGVWTPIELVLGPLIKEQLGHLEMEMDVNSVELKGL